MRRFIAPLIAGLLVWGVGATDLAGSLDRRIIDLRAGRDERPPSGDVVVVAIDAPSLAAFGTWPWPRRTHAELLDRLREAGVARIGFDVDFSSRSPSSEDDAALVAAAARLGPTRLAMPAFQEAVPVEPGVFEVYDILPFPELQATIQPVSVVAMPDPDGLIRRLPRDVEFEAGILPTMSTWLAGRDPAGTETVPDAGITIQDLPHFSYADVLAGRVPAEALAGKLVLIGATDPSLGDEFATPRHLALAGVRLHALATESIHQGRVLQPVQPLPPWLAGGLAFVLAALARRVDLLLALPAGFAILVGVEATALYLRMGQGLELGTALTDITIVASVAIGLADRLRHSSTLIRAVTARLLRQERLTERIVATSLDAIITFDAGGRLRSLNPAARALLGESTDRALADVLLSGAEALRDRAQAGEAARLEVAYRTAAGTAAPAEAAVSSLLDGNERLGILVLQDISERKRHEAALIRLAQVDTLTGLANRRRFHEACAAALDAGSAAVLLLDLDGFKEVNDTLGPGTGDALLSQIGPRLAPLLGANDVLARLGGDEFAILSPRPGDAAAALAFARRINEILREPFAVAGLRIEVGGSIRVVLAPEHGADAATLLRHADVAMYAAKRERLGAALYEQALDGHSVRRLTLQGELRQAIADGAVLPFYQPKLCTRTGRVVGVEALARWEHPVHGFVSPGEFVPMAEQGGLAKELTLAMVARALADRRNWATQGIDIPVAVNIAPRCLRDPNLPHDLQALLAASGTAMDQLSLEVTESAVAAAPDEIETALATLAQAGFKLSVDDFGTGLSSFSRLRHLPVSELKLDRALLAEEGDTRGRAVLRSMVELGATLGLVVVSEGVEDAATHAWLGAIGCPIVQGYHVSKPVPAASLPERVAAIEERHAIVPLLPVAA